MTKLLRQRMRLRQQHAKRNFKPLLELLPKRRSWQMKLLKLGKKKMASYKESILSKTLLVFYRLLQDQQHQQLLFNLHHHHLHLYKLYPLSLLFHHQSMHLDCSLLLWVGKNQAESLYSEVQPRFSNLRSFLTTLGQINTLPLSSNTLLNIRKLIRHIHNLSKCRNTQCLRYFQAQ